MSFKPKQARNNGNPNAGNYKAGNKKSKRTRYDFDDRAEEKRRRAEKLIREYKEKKDSELNDLDM